MRGAAGMSLLVLVITSHSLCIGHLFHRVQCPFYYIIESYPQLVWRPDLKWEGLSTCLFSSLLSFPMLFILVSPHHVQRPPFIVSASPAAPNLHFIIISSCCSVFRQSPPLTRAASVTSKIFQRDLPKNTKGKVKCSISKHLHLKYLIKIAGVFYLENEPCLHSRVLSSTVWRLFFWPPR